jgi:phage I-like protein
MNSIGNQNSNQNYIISKEKKFCENEMLEKLLKKIEKLEKENKEKIEKLENENKELKNEIQKMKSNNNNTNNTLINNIDKPLNELKSKEKVDENTNNIVLIGSRHEKFNENYLINNLVVHGKLNDIKNYISSYYAKVIGLKNTVLFFNKSNNKFEEESYYDFNRTILKPITKIYS